MMYWNAFCLTCLDWRKCVLDDEGNMLCVFCGGEADSRESFAWCEKKELAPGGVFYRQC